MHGGDARGRIALADVVAPTTIAVGALAGLRGEVTVLDGKVRTSRVSGDAIVTTDGAGDGQAALLVVSRVPAWRSVTLRAPIADAAALATALREAGLRPDAPAAFVVEGTLTVLDWHVVDGPHEHGAPSGLVRHTPGRALVVGFYSTAHEGVFTHMGESIHAHVWIDDATGHVDQMAFAAGATLRIPAP